MTAQLACSYATGIEERLRLLREVQANMLALKDEIGAAEAKTRNDRLADPLFTKEDGVVVSIVPVGNNVTASIDLYETLLKTGKMIQPLSTSKVENTEANLTDLNVFPRTYKESLLYATRKDFLRVKGDPKQVNPMDKETSIIGILGGGNISGALEIIKALFYNNCVVVFKPHPLNVETNKVWEKAFQPLVEHKALAFCDADQGPQLTGDKRLSKVYFTGGAKTAEMIAKSTKTTLVSECGGNNPVIVVPGDWTDAEMKHQAMQIASNGKLNGGAVCGRGQTIITSKQWPKREAFLKMIEESIVEDTFATGAYYPGSDKVFEEFQKKYPNAKVLEPEGGKYKDAKCLFITGDSQDSYSCKNEAFCQIYTEVPLDVPATAEDFLPAAVKFSNDKLWGTLCATVLIDGATQKANEDVLSQAVTDLNYGAIAINGQAAMIWFSPYLIWGGNEEDSTKIQSGKGHFGNLLGYENAEKSIAYDAFVSPGHLLFFNKNVVAQTCDGLATMAVNPSWYQHVKFLAKAIYGSLKSKDF
jgi:hypothetical protein